jgi:hypothetical protein
MALVQFSCDAEFTLGVVHRVLAFVCLLAKLIFLCASLA